MKADVIKLDIILQENTILKCPVIQRLYCWNKEEVGQFLDDIILQGKNKRSSQYFIGQVIVRGEEILTLDGVSSYILIEGQQRFVTTSLIYFGLYLFYEKHPELLPKEIVNSEILLKYIYNNNNNTKLKLKLNPSDQVDYQNILDKKFDGNSHMCKMFRIIQKRINKTNHLKILVGLRKLKIVLISLHPEDDANLIFDTVNTRGKPLGFVDKLRNLCLLNLEPQIQEELYQNKWKPFYELFMKYQFDKMLPAWVKGLGIWSYAGRPETYSTNNMIKYLRSYDPFEAIQLINDYDDMLISMMNSEYSKEVSALMEIEAIPAVVGINLIKEACAKGLITESQLKSLVNGIVSYCVRSWIMGQKSNIQYLIYEISFCVKSQSFRIYEDISNLLSNHVGRKWEGIPSNKDIFNKLNMKEWRSYQAKHMLILLESNINSRCGNLEDMTVEHILPMKHDVCLTKQNIKQLLGNLTLLPLKDNSSLSNNTFSNKKHMKGGFDDSTLKIDEYIKQQETWGEPEIIQRTKILSQMICDTWKESVVFN